MPEILQKSESLKNLLKSVKQNGFSPKHAYICTAYINSSGIKDVSEILGVQEYKIVAQVRKDDKKPKLNSDATYHRPECDERMHSKFILLEDGNERRAIIGSSNITSAGMDNNVELNVYAKDEKNNFNWLKGRFTSYKKDENCGYLGLEDDSEDEIVKVDIGDRIVVDESKVAEYENLRKALDRYFEVENKKENDKTVYRITPDSAYRKDGREQKYKNTVKERLNKWKTVQKIQEQVVRIRDESVGKYGCRIVYDGDEDADIFESVIEKIKNMSSKNQSPIKEYSNGGKIGVAENYISPTVDKQDRETLGSTSKYTDDVIENYNGIKFIDERDENIGDSRSINWEPKKELVNNGNSVLHDYQETWVSTFVNNEARRYEIEGPCGSGKTLATVKIVCELSEKTLIICPRIEVCEQWKNTLIENTSVSEQNISRKYNSIDDDEHEKTKVVITTYTNASEKTEEIAKDIGLIIYDESHSLRANTWSRAITEIPSDRKLGLSATSLNSLEDQEDYGFSRIGDEWSSILEEAEGKTVQIPEVYEYTGNGLKDGNHTDGFNRYKKEKISRVSDVVRKERASNNSVLVFVEEIENHGEPLMNALDCPFINGNNTLKERTNAYEKFREGNIQKLIVTSVADEGVNIPQADTAVMASWIGSSQVQGTQRIGRVMRAGDYEARAIFVPITDTEEDKMYDQVKQLSDMKLIEEVREY